MSRDFPLSVAVAGCRGRKSVRIHTQAYKIEEPEGGAGSHQGHAGPLGTRLTVSSHGKHVPGTRLKRYFTPHGWDRMIYVVGLEPFSLDRVKQQVWADVAGKKKRGAVRGASIIGAWVWLALQEDL